MTRIVVLVALTLLTLAGAAALASKPASAYLLGALDIDHEEEPC